MNILLISKYVSPAFSGGILTRGFSLLKELSTLGNNCSLITSTSNLKANIPDFSGLYFNETVEKINVKWIRCINYRRSISLRRLLSWIEFEIKLTYLLLTKNYSPEIVIISSLSLLTIFNGLLAKKLYRCKLIFECRDIWPLSLTEFKSYKEKNIAHILLYWILEKIECLSVTQSDGVISTIPLYNRHYEKTYGIKKPFICVPMGYDESLLNAVKASDRSVKNIKPYKFTVGYCGSFSYTNHLDEIFEVCELLKNKSDIHFLFVGDGDLKEHYIRNYGSLRNVTFKDYVSRNEIHGLLSQCSIVYLSTSTGPIWNYGQSLNKIVDYMLAGKAIIASYSGYQTMINEAECGSFVEKNNPQKLAETILKYSNLSHTQITKIGQNGYNWFVANRTYSHLTANLAIFLKKQLNSCD